MTTPRSVVMTWPPPFVQIRKVAAVGASAHPCGDPLSYRYGMPNPNESFPIDYSVIGWLLRSPVVGEAVHVLRVARNGAIMPGIFVTTEIVRIPRAGEFHTANSIYSWLQIAETPQSVESLIAPRSCRE